MHSHSKRLISAFAPLPVIIWTIYAGGAVFSLLIGVVAVITLWEYFRIMFNLTRKSRFGPMPMIGYVITILLIYAAHMKSFEMTVGFLTLNLLAVAVMTLIRFQSDSTVLEEVAKQVLGVVYVPLLLSFIILIRHSADGATWVFFLVFLVFIEDTGAYYAGTYLGRHKLLPSVSPGKTIEGALGGLSASIAIGIVFKLLFLPELPLGLCFLISITVGIIAPAGDLFESVLKRVGKIKDSGTIMPGHGGILDRIDALLFAAPVVYLFKVYLF